MEKLLKNFFLFMAGNDTFNRLAKKHGLRFGGRRFVAGETLNAAIETVQALNRQGMSATLDHLGEFVTNEEEANEKASHCLRTLEAISESGADANLSLKLTSMGLDISYALCLDNVRRILQKAERLGIFVRIDMEDYARLESTFALFSELRESFDHFGLVIQAYLYRSVEDVKRLAAHGTNLRLVKGAYKESPQVAFPDKKDVDANFRKLIKMQLESGSYAAIATHDEAIIKYTKALVQEKNIPLDRFEFQLLYGIRPELQKRLVSEGYRVRIYVPYGNDWYGYFMRRLAERPANVGFVVKGLMKR